MWNQSSARIWAGALLAGVGLPLAVLAGSHSAVSNVTTVDTRGELRSVSGRVIAANTRAALPGVTVTYAGSTRTTDTGGEFAFEGGTWPNGQELTASKDGYATARKRVQAPSGAQDFVVPDIPLSSGYPMVVGVEGDYDVQAPRLSGSRGVRSAWTVPCGTAAGARGSVSRSGSGTGCGSERRQACHRVDPSAVR